MAPRLPSLDVLLARIPRPPGPLYSIGVAARLIGRSVPTLRRWRRERKLDGTPVSGPTWALWQFGRKAGLRTPLWSDEDISRGQKIADDIRPGPTPGTGGAPKQRANR